jgi:hypothetical protein
MMDWFEEEVPRIARHYHAAWRRHEIPPMGDFDPYPGPDGLMARVARETASQWPLSAYADLLAALDDPSRLPPGEDDPNPFPDPATQLKC